MKRVMRHIPDLVAQLRSEAARTRDYIVPAPMTELAQVDSQIVMRFLLKDGVRVSRRVQPQVHGQIAAKLGVPLAYYERMLQSAPGLLATNANYWFRRLSRKNLIRCIDDEVRALVSDRYRPISHLDLVTTAVQVVAGKDREAGEERPWARGARGFGWHLTPTKLDVCLLNPSIAVDLEDLAAGVVTDGGVSACENEAHFWVKPDRPDGHWVFPAARMRNSETGHGGLYVQAGLFEAVCSNSAWLPVDLAERHLGGALNEDEVLSGETYRKMNAAIFSVVADVVRQVFEPGRFLEACKRFKGLQAVEVEVTEAVDEIVRLPGMTEALRDEILAAYQPLVPERHTLFDVQRAVTSVAVGLHNKGESERAFALEDLGGELIERGEKALRVAS